MYFVRDLTGREATLRSTDIAVINFKKPGSRAWAITLGIVGGLMAGGAFAAGADPDAADQGVITALVLGGMALGGTGGALLGSRLSRKTVVINVRPIR